MKNIIYLISLGLCVLSCEDVIDIQLDTEPERLVIDASMNWLEGTSGNEQSIKLSLTAPYLDDIIPPANNAVVTISDTNNTIFNFVENGNSGIYTNSNFQPILNETYSLAIEYESEVYTATETLKPVASIDFIEQTNTGGFSGEDIEIKAYYTDPENEENYYLFDFKTDITAFPILEVYNDEFTNGNQIFGYYTEEDLEAGDEVTIRSYGISEQYYEFMFVLLQQNSEEGGGPFETQPATVRGNCVNTSNPDHFPLGYFRLSEQNEVIYIVE